MSKAACHDPNNAPAGIPMSYGGTVYSDKAGSTALAGATILITMGATTVKAISGTNGNFYLTPSMLAAPSATTAAMTAASLCTASPTKVPMSGALHTAGGDCNSSGCHGIGSSQGAIHIP
jgi:hypothetical protein